MNVHVDGIAHIVPRLTAVTTQKQTANLRREAKFFESSGLMAMLQYAAGSPERDKSNVFRSPNGRRPKFSPTVSAAFALPQRRWFVPT
jgi:hypothetical protein